MKNERRLVLDGTVATLNDTGKWSCESKNLRYALDTATGIVLSEIGPSDGDPLSVAFMRVAALVEADEAENTVPPPPPAPEGIVY